MIATTLCSVAIVEVTARRSSLTASSATTKNMKQMTKMIMRMIKLMPATKRNVTAAGVFDPRFLARTTIVSLG